MARLAALLAVALQLASHAEIAAECVAGECEAAADEDSSLLAVSMSKAGEARPHAAGHKAGADAAGHEKAGAHAAGHKAGADAAGHKKVRPHPAAGAARPHGPAPLKMNRGGEARRTALQGASLLCMKFAVPRSLGSEAAKGALWGEPREGGFSLQEGEHVLVTVAQFPDAPIGWSAGEGSSERVSVPHTLFSVQVPIHDGAQALGQTAYALTDDDTAMNIYRMGENIPAKTATFDLAGAPGPAEAARIRINRRGVQVFEVSDIAPHGGSVGQQEVDEFFQKPTREWGTGVLQGNFPLNYLSRSMRPTKVKKVTKVSIGKVSVSNSALEKLDALLGSGASVISAYRVEADLEVTSQMESVAKASGTYSVAEHPELVNAWRDLGPQLTKMKKDLSNRMAYQNGDITWASFKINRAGIAPYLPPGVTLDQGDAVCWLTRWQPADAKNPWSSKYGKVGPMLFEYNELWVEVPVVIHGTKYWYPMIMLLNDDVAMIGGRDNACPKKMADIDYVFSPKVQKNAGLAIDITRRGKPVLRLTGHLGAPASSPKPVRGLSDNAKDAPPYAMLSILSYSHDPKVWRPSWYAIKSVNKATLQHPLHNVKVELGGDETAPLAKWFTGPPTDAGFVRMHQDWTLASGGAQKKPVELEGYQDWWRRNFALLYM